MLLLEMFTADYFKTISVIKIIDIVLVSILFFQLYRVLKGSIAFNIFVGLLAIYLLYIIVLYFNMPLLSEFLDRFISIGLIGLIIVFQPEVRKFLIIIGKNSPVGKNGFLTKLMQSSSLKKYEIEEEAIDQITKALKFFIDNKLGALLVITKTENTFFDTNSGIKINGLVNSKLLESIFVKESPLHDGAVVIDKNTIIAAHVVLPISDSAQLPSRVGLRHRAAVGASENSDVLAILVSEEKNTMAYAIEGKLYTDVSMDKIKKELYNAMLK